MTGSAAGPGVVAATLLVALGGALGSTGRYLVDVALAGPGGPGGPDGWPWSTLVVNVSGCLAIGALSRWIARRSPHPLLRPFLVVGVLGGWTTFSAFAVQVVVRADDGQVALAALYLGVTMAACLGAVAFGAAAVGTAVPERGQDTG